VTQHTGVRKTRPGFIIALIFIAVGSLLLLWPLAPAPYIPTPVPFSYTVANLPATWPCEDPVTWAYNPQSAPSGTFARLTNVMDMYSETTGLTFLYLGTTDVTPSTDLATPSPREADIMIGWAHNPVTGLDPSSNLLDPDDVAVAGKTLTATSYVSGVRFIRETQFNLTEANVIINLSVPSKTASERTAVLVHEMGHVAGLSHAPENSQSIMETVVIEGISRLQPSDVTALRNLYAQCRVG
jgi:hypothetical protein